MAMNSPDLALANERVVSYKCGDCDFWWHGQWKWAQYHYGLHRMTR